MKGDFARMTFQPSLHFSRVMHQQGRVLLEADWNEQAAIQLHLLRSLVVDLVGACWAAGDGFSIANQTANGQTLPLKDWRLSPGHFYVDGILCAQDAETTLALQPYRPTADDADDGSSAFERPRSPFLLYLHAWERHLSAVESPGILDRALGGIDTASRAQVVWQVRMLSLEDAQDFVETVIAALRLRDDLPPFAQELLDPDFDVEEQLKELYAKLADEDDARRAEACDDVRILLTLRNAFAFPRLKASLGAIDSDADACIIAPDARYRGCENQLYRVEIHAPGPAWRDQDAGATFKWSRENGSVVFPVVTAPAEAGEAEGGTAYVIGLAHLGRDARLGLAVGDWVELSDDTIALAQRARPLLQVTAIDTMSTTVTVVVPETLDHVPSLRMHRHPLLRRWDQREEVGEDGALPVREGGDGIELEDGVTIAFEPGGVYATGDYWVIPARVADNGSLDWPMDANRKPLAVKAGGLPHYAALGAVDAQDQYRECCCRVAPLCERRRPLSNDGGDRPRTWGVGSMQPRAGTAPSKASSSTPRKAVGTRPAAKRKPTKRKQQGGDSE